MLTQNVIQIKWKIFDTIYCEHKDLYGPIIVAAL